MQSAVVWLSHRACGDASTGFVFVVAVELLACCTLYRRCTCCSV